MMILTTINVWTAVCLTLGDCMPTQKHNDLFDPLVPQTGRALQRLFSCFAEAAQLFGLEVSLKKTEFVHQPAPLEEYRHPHTIIGWIDLTAVHQFAYLRCTISSDDKIDREVDNRLAKANIVFGRLYKSVWNSKHLKKGTKISVYRSIVLTILPYGYEW